jgi:glycosyltransferase involved in cell wall biosynthesis
MFTPKRSLSTRVKYDWTCDGVIAVSESIKNRLLQAGVASQRIEVIQDGVEIPADLPDSELHASARAEWGFAADEFVAGHIGAFSKEKGQDIAIAAIRLVSQEMPRARLVLAGYSPAGTGAFERAVKSAAGQAGDRVRLLGYVESLKAFLAGIDVYIMPSRSEGLGSSALIAMAHGIPVVATRVGGLAEVVEPGKTGWLVEPEAAGALADALRCAASDRRRLCEFGRHARQRAQHFSSCKMVERTESFYQRLLACAPR